MSVVHSQVKTVKVDASFLSFCCYQRRCLRHKSMICSIDRGKIIVLHVRHAFWCNVWRNLANDDVKCFDFLRFWRQHDSAAVNLSFFAFAWKPLVPSNGKCTSPILYTGTNMESSQNTNLMFLLVVNENNDNPTCILSRSEPIRGAVAIRPNLIGH